MNRAAVYLVPLVVAVGLMFGLSVLEAVTPGLQIGAIKYVVPIALAGTIYMNMSAQSGNRKVALASAAERDVALAFTPRSGDSGTVVVIRPRGGASYKLGYNIVLDGIETSQLMPKQFVVLPVSVGQHTVFADLPESAAPGKSKIAPTEVAVSDGEVIFFQARSSMGLVRSSVALEAVPDSAATRAMLGKLDMVRAPDLQPAFAV